MRSEQNKKWQIPNTLALIFSIMIIVTLLTWIIPGGKYDRNVVDGRSYLVADSYHTVENVPQTIFDLLTSPIRGFIEAAEIIAFVLIVGGAFTILQKSGAVDAFIKQIFRLQKNHPVLQKILIPVFIITFSYFGSLFGMSEEVIPFILIFVPLFISLGYDSLLGAAIPFVGAGVGFASAFVNPFTLQIAQGIAELPPLSGMGYRIICWSVFTLTAIIFMMIYAAKIKRNPKLSPVYGLDDHWRQQVHVQNDHSSPVIFDIRHKIVLVIFLLTLVILIFGVLKYEWFITEIAGLFMGMAILLGIASKMKANDLAVEFVKGAAAFMNVAFIIAAAKSILILAADGQIIDTILHQLSELVSGAHAVFAAQLMFIVQSAINVFIPSGSGQAALVMPIMSPLSDLLGVSRQTAVLAFQFGDGLTNLIIPTSGITMGVLGIARIPFEKWFRWMLPLMIILFLLGFILLIPPVLMNWS